jgi:hypothetical protein
MLGPPMMGLMLLSKAGVLQYAKFHAFAIDGLAQ